MHRPRNQNRSRVAVAQAAMEQCFAELYAKHGSNFSAEDVEKAWHNHNGPRGLTHEEFAEVVEAFLAGVFPCNP